MYYLTVSFIAVCKEVVRGFSAIQFCGRFVSSRQTYISTFLWKALYFVTVIVTSHIMLLTV